MTQKSKVKVKSVRKIHFLDSIVLSSTSRRQGVSDELEGYLTEISAMFVPLVDPEEVLVFERGSSLVSEGF